MRNNLQVILSILIVLLFLPFYNNAQNLVLYTSLDDASSITSPSTGPAGSQNGGSFSAAQYNDGFLADANNEYVTFDIGASTGTESGKLNQNKGTIAFWYKPNYNSSADHYCWPFAISALGANNISMKSEKDFDFGDNIFFYVAGTSRATDDFSSTSWSSGDLVHIAVVWDASGSNSDIDGGNSAAIYINGSVTASGNTTWTPSATNSTDLFIGRYINAQGNANGVLDDFYVYDDVLTSTQINNLKDTQALPVELTSFSANLFKNSVNLNWATATEVNNYGFEIERTSPAYSFGGELGTQSAEISEAGDGWEKIGFVNGHGNSNSPKFYSFVDNLSAEAGNAPSGELQYRLKQIDFDGAFEYSDVVIINNSQNYKFDLEQNYPNPFNPTTTISFTVPNVVDANFASTTLKVYDVLGSEIAVLFNEKKSPGNYKVDFDASNFASGMYFYTLTSGSFRQTKKMLLIK